MVGGYLTFQGIEAKAQYAGSPVEEALPVTLCRHDDRVERPEGVAPGVALPVHAIAAGLPAVWPGLMGYNRLTPREGAEVVARVGEDPLIVAGRYGTGRSVAFASDCSPHWAPADFVEWPGYASVWAQIAAWAAGRA